MSSIPVLRRNPTRRSPSNISLKPSAALEKFSRSARGRTYLSQQCARPHVEKWASRGNLGTMRQCDPRHLLVVPLRGIILSQQIYIFHGHVDLIEVFERTSDDSWDTVFEGHDIRRAALEHRHIWRSHGHHDRKQKKEQGTDQHHRCGDPGICRDLSFSLRTKAYLPPPTGTHQMSQRRPRPPFSFRNLVPW